MPKEIRALVRGHKAKKHKMVQSSFRGWSVKNWTSADDERLRELVVEGMDARKLGVELNRTATAVRSRAFRLNLTIPTVPRSGSLKFSQAGTFYER
jgi:hypothetical protein